MKFGTNIQVPQRMNLTDFGDPLNFTLAPPRGYYCTNSNLINTLMFSFWMNCYNFAHSLTFHLAPPSGQTSNLSNTFPSAALCVQLAVCLCCVSCVSCAAKMVNIIPA